VSHVALTGATSDVDLLLIELHVALLEFTHFFDFIQVHYKALLHVVELANTFSAKDRRVLRAVEVLDALVVLLAQVRLNVVMSRKVLRLQTLVEVDVGQ